eukprot:scaffold22589_cov138-Cylindrotheca_fusiformis.AAC.52
MASWTLQATSKAIPPDLHMGEDSPTGKVRGHVETGNVLVSPSIVRPKPVRISASGQVKPVAMKIVRPIPQVKPVAMKVVRPIPQRASEQFYDNVYREGISNQEASGAAVMAHEWHRKWTQQQETHHDVVDQDFYQDDSRLPSYYDVQQDRSGANNPFMIESSTPESIDDDGLKRCRTGHGDTLNESEPEVDLEALYCNPDDRLSSISTSQSPDSGSFGFDLRQMKRRNVGSGSNRLEDGQERNLPWATPSAVRPAVVRPLVIRSSRAEEIPMHDDNRGFIPEVISTFENGESISPISSCFLQQQSEEHDPITIVNRQEEEIHFVEDDEDLSECSEPNKSVTSVMSENNILARDDVLHALAITRGDVDSETFTKALDPLLKYYSSSEVNPRSPLSTGLSLEGMWLQLSKPTYFGCLGENDRGDPLYTLGRMSFDMFSPTNVICSLQGNFNPVEIVDDEQRRNMLQTVPKKLREEVESGTTVLRTYHILTAFTIEAADGLATFPNAPNKDVDRSIRGIMTTYGYSLPDPEIPDRYSIWFTGGCIEPNNDPSDIDGWKRLFTLHPPKHTFGEKAKLLAVKLLMGATLPEGMDENGRMEFAFTRPIGGHGTAFVDVIYIDNCLRVVRGHRGTIMVFSRLPS